MEVSERTPIEDSSSTMQHSRGFYPLDPISLNDFGLRQKHDATLSRIRAVRPHFLKGFWAPPGTGHNPIEDQGWVTKTKDSMFSVSKTNPIEDSSAGSPKIAKQYVFLYASRQRQSKPTAKPKASLHCVYIYIYICLCMQVYRSRASQPPNPKPFCIVYSNRHKQGNPNDKRKALLSLQAEQPNRQTESHSGKLRKTYTRLCMQIDTNGTT